VRRFRFLLSRLGAGPVAGALVVLCAACTATAPHPLHVRLDAGPAAASFVTPVHISVSGKRGGFRLAIRALASRVAAAFVRFCPMGRSRWLICLVGCALAGGAGWCWREVCVESDASVPARPGRARATCGNTLSCGVTPRFRGSGPHEGVIHHVIRSGFDAVLPALAA
jgi:hypothetical protein